MSGTYVFNADFTIERTGDLSQSEVGNLFFKPTGNVRYGNRTEFHDTNGNGASVTDCWWVARNPLS